MRLLTPMGGMLLCLLIGCGGSGEVCDPSLSCDDVDGESSDAASPNEERAVRFGAAGDFGGRDEFGGAVMNDVLARDLSSLFVLGDLSYDEITPEQAWCDWIHGYLGNEYPVQILAGNHEDDALASGHIASFAECLPDRLDSALGPGGYGVNYASDLGPLTLIATSPALEIEGVYYDYQPGSSEHEWLIQAITAARQEGDWVVVGMHKNCLTIGRKECEIGQALAQLLIDEGVDLVLQVHEHNYQRTHSLTSIVEDGVGAIAADGADGRYPRGAGTVFVIAGTTGAGTAECFHDDGEYDNFAAHWCDEEGEDSKGYLVLSADPVRLTAEYVVIAGPFFIDSFAIE